MKELVICIFSSGPNANEENIRLTFESIEANIGIDDYQYYIFTSNNTVSDYYYSIIPNEKIYQIVVSNQSFAKQFNSFYNDCKNDFEYLIYSHDDLIIGTNNFYEITKDSINKYEDKVGWITYTNNGYTSSGKLVSNSIREGIHKDRFNFPKVYECHIGDLNKLDYPKEPVIVFGPYTHFNMISFKSLSKIGLCEDWDDTPTLVDENWCLKSNIENKINIWIPNIFYKHPIPWTEQLRKSNSLRGSDNAHKGFIHKWGFDINYSDDVVKFITNKYPNSMLAEFAQKNTYEWIYLNNLR
jgi:hypothetical protein